MYSIFNEQPIQNREEGYITATFSNQRIAEFFHLQYNSTFSICKLSWLPLFGTGFR